ncbi:vacuolar basic amino acid transporter 1 [[Candida] jaroonii]|uniref:Vacuolar basic amino acid transporter 1 n=1 Tax=[Candida] jaroonii TaxID=467808 RepID=A0ACA9YFQ6_9ASCO|nr:vacuolar basic amino acid transporter 1 [[Candida] jaroonii]
MKKVAVIESINGIESDLESQVITPDNQVYGSTEELNLIDKNDGYAVPRRQLYYIAFCLDIAAFLAALDATVVSTLLTVIASDFGSLGSMSWLATSYLLSCSALQPIYGKLSDIFGRKILLIGCCIFFALGCGICTINSINVVIFGRFITGIGGSGLTCLSTITLSDLVPPRDRGVYQGYLNIFFGLGTATGGMFGGVISDYLGWKYAFGLQIPIAIFVGIAIYFNLNLPEGSPGLGVRGHIRHKLSKIDFLGSFLLVSSLLIILTVASLAGNTLKLTSKTFAFLCILALVLFSCFIHVEKNTSQPIIPIDLMRIRTVSASALTNWFYTMGVFTYLFYVPVYYNSVMSFSGTKIGTRLIPNFFVTSIGSVGAGYYMKRTGGYRRLVYFAAFLAISGMLNILTITPDISIPRQFLLIVPAGFSYSIILTTTLLALISAVPSKFQAGITSISYTFRATGSTLGVSMASAIFHQVLQSALNREIPSLVNDKALAKEVIEKALESTDYVNEAPEFIKTTLRECYDCACKGALSYALVCILLGVTSSLFMKENSLSKSINRQ